MDMERYGDYNELDESPYKKKSKAGLIIKLLIGFVILFVAGILTFRIIIFNYYPSGMSELYPTPTLQNYYKENDEIYAETQELRTPYDDPNEGNFFCDNLIVVKDAGHLQVSLRYNVSIFENIAEKYGVDSDADSFNNFSVRLVRDPVDDSQDDVDFTPVGNLTLAYTDELFMYKYHKLIFDGIDFEGVEWLSLEVYPNGFDRAEPYRILIYENHKDFSDFTEFEVNTSEVFDD